MLMHIRHSVALLAVAGLWVPANAAALTFTPLGDLAGGDFNSTANGISNDGNVVVGTGDAALDTEAFRWTLVTGMVSLGDFPGGGDASLGYATDADGSRVVGQGSNAQVPGGPVREAFRWDTPLGPMTGLGFLGGSPLESTAFGVSADGSVIVGRSSSASGAEAFRWTAGGGMVTLGDFPTGATQSVANAVSDDGSVIVGAGAHFGPISEAFRWTSVLALQGLGDLAGGITDSRARGVSGDGNTVVGDSISGNGIEAFVWTVGSGMDPLSDLAGGAFESRAYDANSTGSLIVGHGTAADGQRAVIWNAAHTIFDLNLIAAAVLPAGWLLEEAFGISSDGLSIVGRANNPDGNNEAFLLRIDANSVPVPEPSSGLLIALGLLAFAAARRR